IRGYLESVRMYRGSYLLMILASFLPWIAVYFNIRNSTFLRIDYYSLMMIGTGILYLFGLFRYDIFNTVPIATETVYRLSGDAIALIDNSGRITDVNAAFLKLYPEMKRLTVKSTQNDFLARHHELRGLSPEKSKIRFYKEDNQLKRYFSAELIGIQTESGIPIGNIVQIKDISLFVKYQNQLKQLAEQANERAETNELSFLQAQISPHFINNTLSAICSLISRDDDAAKDLVVNLSEYLISCYRIGSSSPMDTLEHELEAVDTYVQIVYARFGGRIRYTAEVTAPLALELPRLILQPLVENAIRHGLQPKKDGGTVRLSVETDGECARFEISDDGVGIEPARIPSLLSGEDDKQGVGMINIHKRLLKYYGEGLNIKSGSGTSVSFRIPLTKAVREG
ncbi:MAG TPA: histidine kinase, partial [Clostridia bacterium]|nr:histidine kinase [Clostridia bacterium]